MKKRYLEAGKIVNTHGITGEVKLVPWADGPEFLTEFHTLYVDGQPLQVQSARVHKGTVLVRFAGVEDVNGAMRLRDKVVSIDREDAHLPQGRHFLADLIGLEVRDADTGAVLGTIADILTPPASEVYVVRGGGEEHLIPAVDEFVKQVDVDGGFVTVKLIEGM